MQTFVSVFKKGSFINFQQYLPVWMKQLKNYAFSIDQLLGGKGINAVKGGNYNGFILELPDSSVADQYFTTKTYPKVLKTIGVVAGQLTLIAANLVPGSVSVVLSNGVFLVDDGDGNICRVDGNNTKVGTINYTTGKYVLDEAIVSTDAKAWVNYAVVGTNVSYAKIGGTGTTVKGFDTGLIPNGQCFFTLQVIVSTKSKKMFIGFSSNDAGKQEIVELLGDVIPAVDESALKSAIASAQALHDGATEGTEIGQYAVGSKAILQAAIDAAKAVDEDDTALQAEVDAALEALETAVGVFESGIVPAPDKTALESAIASAQALHDGATEGEEIGNYAVGSKAILQTAIDTAQAVVDDATALQAEVDDALEALENAVGVFEAGIVTE